MLKEYESELYQSNRVYCEKCGADHLPLESCCNDLEYFYKAQKQGIELALKLLNKESKNERN